jgi:hypothetical protein
VVVHDDADAALYDVVFEVAMIVLLLKTLDDNVGGGKDQQLPQHYYWVAVDSADYYLAE